MDIKPSVMYAMNTHLMKRITAYEFDVTSKKSGLLTVVPGIFAAKKTNQLYYFKNVCITLIKQ